METVPALRAEDDSQAPSETSLEGWKLCFPPCVLKGRGFFRNFLRGMETPGVQPAPGPGPGFRNFLRGMETLVPRLDRFFHAKLPKLP